MYYWGPAGHFYSLWFQSTALNAYNPRIFLPLSDGFLKGSADDSGCVHIQTFIFSLEAKQYRHSHGGQIYGWTFISCLCRRTFTEHAWQVSSLGPVLIFCNHLTLWDFWFNFINKMFCPLLLIICSTRRSPNRCFVLMEMLG